MKPLMGLLSLLLVTVACSGTKSFNVTEFALSEEKTAFGDIPTPILPVNPTPPPENMLRDVIPLWEGKVSSGRAWSDYVDQQLEILGTQLLDTIPSDRATFCPNYAGLTYSQRKQYWAFMLSAMARFESSFNTTATYTEDFTDSSGRAVVSRGLLQISFESATGYDCDLKKATDLHDPLKNLACGIRILNHWVPRDGRIAGLVSDEWRGGARYWSVLRDTRKESFDSIVKWSRALSICK